MVRKESIDAERQERSSGLLIRSPVSSTSRGTGRGGKAAPDKQRHAALSPADDNMEYVERGQHLLAEPSTDRLTDIPPDFDLPFLAGLGQGTGGHDGDDGFNLALAPWTPFSSVLPDMHPEPARPAVARSPENLLTPSSSSADDETSRNLPSTGQSHEPTGQFHQPTPSFQVRSDANAAAAAAAATATASSVSSAPTLVPTGLSFPTGSGQPCRCLAAVVFAVEEFEASCNSGTRGELDSIVADQKEAIKLCRLMLQCGSCMVKRENLVLLVFMIEKIVAACGRIVILYRVPSSSSSISFPFPSPPPPSHQALPRPPSSSSSILSPADWRELLCGDYEIDSPVEWEHLMRILIGLQFRAVTQLLADTKTTGRTLLGEAQTASLVQAETRLAEFQKDIMDMAS